MKLLLLLMSNSLLIILRYRLTNQRSLILKMKAFFSCISFLVNAEKEIH